MNDIFGDLLDVCMLVYLDNIIVVIIAMQLNQFTQILYKLKN